MTSTSRASLDRTAGARWLELDVVRGFAVVGIFWINIVYFGWPYEANLYPTLFGGSDGLNILSWGVNHLFFGGAMFALFSMLFGASTLMLLSEHRLADPGGLQAVDYYYRRNLWLIGFGLAHAFVLLWPLEILFTYGVLGLGLFPLRRLKPATLLIIGVMMVAWGSYAWLPLETEPQVMEVARQQQAPPARLTEMDRLIALEEVIDDIRAEMALYHSDYPSIFLANIEFAVGQQATNLYEDNIWDAGGMMLVGMALFKWGVLSGQRSLAFYLALTVMGYVAALLLRLPAVIASINSGFDPDQVVRITSAQYLIGRLPLALGHIGSIMLLCRWQSLRSISRALAAAGRLALTNYVGQTLFSIALFYGFGFGLFGELTYYQLILVAMAFGAFQVLISLFWLRYFCQGPLEWLWRCLIRLERQPFRKPSSEQPIGVVPPVAVEKSLPLP